MASSATLWWGDLWLLCCTEAREGGRPGISMSYRRTTSAWIPIMCQLFRMRSNCTVGKGPHGPQCCGFPPPWARCQALPHTASLTRPATTKRHPTPPRPTPTPLHPTHIIPQTLPPITTSPLFHIPRGALVKSNPIIRHSAVQEKKENFPLVNSRFPFFFSPLPSCRGKTTLWAPLASCLCLSSGLIYPVFLSLAPSFFFCQWYKIASVLGPRSLNTWEGHIAEGPHGSVVQDHAHTHIQFYAPNPQM